MRRGVRARKRITCSLWRRCIPPGGVARRLHTPGMALLALPGGRLDAHMITLFSSGPYASAARDDAARHRPGGDEIAAVALADDGAVLWQRRIPTPRDDYDGTIDANGTLVDEGDRVARWRPPVGIGMPGTISPATGLVKNANSTWLNGLALLGSREHTDRPVRLANDAKLSRDLGKRRRRGSRAAVVFAIIRGLASAAVSRSTVR